MLVTCAALIFSDFNYRNQWPWAVWLLLAGVSLPVAAFFLLGVYGKNLPVLIAVTILGIGHNGYIWDIGGT